MEHLTPITQIYATERDRLQRLVFRLTRRRTTAEDIVHDAFLRLIAMPDGQIMREQAWLTRVARNLALNHLRDESRAPVSLTTDGDLDGAVHVAPSVETQLIDRDNLRRVMRAILALPPRRREIFVRHRFHDLTYDQIAQELAISRNTVMVQIVNALADLRRDLGPDFFHPGT